MTAILSSPPCRVPLPWSGKQPPFGFGPEGSVPWLPQPTQWKDLTAEAESGSDASMLELYRAALRMRRAEQAQAADKVLISSTPLQGRVLPPDCAAWLRSR